MLVPSNLGTTVDTAASFHGAATLAKSKMRTLNSRVRAAPAEKESETKIQAVTG